MNTETTCTKLLKCSTLSKRMNEGKHITNTSRIFFAVVQVRPTKRELQDPNTNPKMMNIVLF